MRLLVVLALVLFSASHTAAGSSAFACYGKGAVGFQSDAEEHRKIVRYAPESYFTMRIGDDEISTDRFQKPLSCGVSGTDVVSCTSEGVLLAYNSSTKKYVLTFFGRGPVVLEIGTCVWLVN
jgi:hypothetical protein